MALIDGKARELEPLQPGPTADFGEPIGEGETIFTLHSEVLTFGDSFGVPNVTFALSLSPKVLESLEKLRGASEERIAEDARSASPPSAKTVSIHIVEVTGGDTVVRARSVTPPNAAWGLGGGIISTATPAAAAVRLLARGAIGDAALPPSYIDRQMFASSRGAGALRLHQRPAEERRKLAARWRMSRYRRNQGGQYRVS
jgi:hypothetical protein